MYRTRKIQGVQKCNKDMTALESGITTESGGVVYEALNSTNMHIYEIQEAIKNNEGEKVNKEKLDGLFKGKTNLRQFIGDLLRMLMSKQLVGHIVSIDNIEKTLTSIRTQSEDNMEVPYKNAIELIQYKKISKLTLKRVTLIA